MRGNGGRRCSGTVALSLRGGTKRTCKHVRTPTLKSALELRQKYVKSVGKVNHTLRVKLSHPYISTCENKCLRILRRVIGEWLKTRVW